MAEEFGLQMERWDSSYRSKGAMWRGLPLNDIRADDGSRILELGCGNGKTMSAVVGRDVRMVGLDFSMVGLKLCPPDVMGRVELVQGDAGHLPFRDGCFDMVIAHHLLGHLALPHRLSAVSEIERVLSPGGEVRVLVLSTGDMRFSEGGEIEANTFLNGSGIATHFFSEAEVRELFSSMMEVSLSETVIEKRYSGMPVRRATIDGIFRV